MNEIEMIEAVQKELSKQYLEVSRLEHENEKLKTILKEARNKLADCLFKLYDENGHSYITLEQELQNILPKIDGVLK